MKTVFGALIVAVAVSAVAWVTLDAPVADSEDAKDDRDIVVLLHGLGRTETAMWRLADRLEDGGYRVERIGYHSLRDTPEEILEDIGRQIDACCIGASPKLHFVGHSLGGLLIRAYLTDHDIANLGRVVLIASPSTGSEMVDNLRHRWWFQVLGPMAQTLGTDGGSFPKTIGPPDYPLGVIAGKTTGNDNEDLLPGDDDGLVSVESTKVAGMTDFVVVDSSHWALRYDETAARHVLNFLETGQFDRSIP